MSRIIKTPLTPLKGRGQGKNAACLATLVMPSAIILKKYFLALLLIAYTLVPLPDFTSDATVRHGQEDEEEICV